MFLRGTDSTAGRGGGSGGGEEEFGEGSSGAAELWRIGTAESGGGDIGVASLEAEGMEGEGDGVAEIEERGAGDEAGVSGNEEEEEGVEVGFAGEKGVEEFVEGGEGGSEGGEEGLEGAGEPGMEEVKEFELFLAGGLQRGDLVAAEA